MPLFMDVHNLGDPVTLNDVAHAHAADLQHQDAHDVRYLRYWVDEPNGKIFCLVDAPRRRGGGDRAPRSPRAGGRRDLPGPGRGVMETTGSRAEVASTSWTAGAARTRSSRDDMASSRPISPLVELAMPVRIAYLDHAAEDRIAGLWSRRTP